MFKNLLDLYWTQQQKYTTKTFCHTKYNKDDWTGLSYRDIQQQTMRIASALKQHGIQRGDRVIILSESRNEFLVADLAIMLIGAISVPTYTTNTENDHSYIITDSGAKAVFISNESLAKIFLLASTRLHLTTIFSFDKIKGIPIQSANIITWEEMLKTPICDTIDDDLMEIRPDDTACILYTSGTSGNPKGVMLTHRSIIANVIAAIEIIKGFDKPLDSITLVSFLPLSHAYEHTLALFVLSGLGGQIYFTPSLDKLIPTIQEVKPHFVTCVPRLYEMIRTQILTRTQDTSALKQKMLFKTLELGQKHYETRLSLTEKIQNTLLNILVRRKVQKGFGGNIMAFVSGGAPLSYDIGIFFTALGFTVIQGYGQTECSPLVAVNHPKSNNIASVGKALNGTDIKIAKDGEILIKGDLLMKGYWNKPKATAETIINGWLHTGDVGEISADGYLYITDRKKDIIVNTGGDNIAPQRIESILCLPTEIEQAMVYGDKKPHIVALIVPNADLRNTYPQSTEGITHPELKSKIDTIIGHINKSLSPVERIRNFAILYDEFSRENNLMTTTLKIRRKPIINMYKDTIERMYKSHK